MNTKWNAFLSQLMGAQPASGGSMKRIGPQEARQIMEGEQPYTLLDVRTPEEFREAHIPGAVLLPVDEVGDKAEGKLPDKGALIIVYCRSGSRSAMAARRLNALGYTSIRDLGGIMNWPYQTVSGGED